VPVRPRANSVGVTSASGLDDHRVAGPRAHPTQLRRGPGLPAGKKNPLVASDEIAVHTASTHTRDATVW